MRRSHATKCRGCMTLNSKWQLAMIYTQCVDMQEWRSPKLVKSGAVHTGQGVCKLASHQWHRRQCTQAGAGWRCQGCCLEPAWAQPPAHGSQGAHECWLGAGLCTRRSQPPAHQAQGLHKMESGSCPRDAKAMLCLSLWQPLPWDSAARVPGLAKSQQDAHHSLIKP